MNVKRFTARTSREALALVKLEFGEEAVVMSTRPCPEGVEVVAMASESVMQLERVGAATGGAAAGSGAAPAGRAQRPAAPVAWTAPERSAAARAAAARDDAQLAPDSRPPASWTGLQGRQRLEPSLEPAPQARAAGPSDEQRWPVRAERGAFADSVPSASAAAVLPTRASPAAASVQRDVKELEMSTLSFQEYVRQRMLKRRDAELAADASALVSSQPSVVSPIEAARKRLLASHRQAMTIDERRLPVLHDEVSLEEVAAQSAAAAAAAASQTRPAPVRAAAPAAGASASASAPQRREQTEMMSELRSMRGLIEQRFGALAFMEKLQRQPRQAQLAQRLLDAGFSPGLIRRLVDGLPADVDEQAWAATVLERNLLTGEHDVALEEQGGVYAMIGTTGVGKTTSTAKLAAAFAATHGANNLGLVTLDAYRVGAHEQLRTYGRILGVPVHTAHDRASLEDLLELLAGKRMVLIDTAGMAQRDSRTRELLEMVSHSAVKRLLVINASAQGETIEDQLAAYGAQSCSGVVLSKLDEAVKLGPALDSMVRHKLKVVAVANGQRVPEDWHRLSARALVQRALRGGGSPAWKLSDNEVNLIFAGMPITAPAVPVLSARA
jgi:flagellar biosynthesis protein FlhF